MTLRNRVEKMITRLAERDVNMHGFILSVGGEDLATAYYRPFREGQPHRMYSVSKTMTGLAVGMLADEGRLKLDDRIAAFFPDLLSENPDKRILHQTIRDMLRMATCYRETAYREELEDWTKPFFQGKPSHEPGTVFHYDTGASQVLAALVKRISGQEVMDYLEQRLFKPLGLRDARFWLRDPSGCCQGGTGLCMSLRDMHRIACCLLAGGEQLVPAWYLTEMTKKQIETVQRQAEEEKYGYGWQCWMTRAGWSMYGMGGQLYIVCPDRQTVFSTIADTRLDSNGVQKIYDAFFEEVYPFADKETMPPTRFDLNVNVLPHRDGCEEEHSGLFLFEPDNLLGLKWLRLEENRLVYEQLRGQALLPFQPGAWLETSYPGWPEVPALTMAGWLEPGLLRIRCFAIGSAPCGFEWLLCFRDSQVTVQSMCSSDPVTAEYNGVATGMLSADSLD